MNEKFTRGEWYIEDWQGVTNVDHEYSIIAGTGEYIAHIENCNLEEQEANANLIRTAPEMYECVCDALTDLDMPDGMRNHFKTVLKKARGEE